jgi:DNA replication factor GINS
MKIQQEYQIYKKNKSKDSRDDNQITVPINSTPEEEGLYLELVDSLIKYRGRLTAPLMSYIQKNQGNHSGTHGNKSKKEDKSLKSINIDELLSDAQAEALVDDDESKDKRSQGGDFENQIFERFGSEPSRREKAKNESDISEKSDKTVSQDQLENTSSLDPQISNGSERELLDKEISLKESEKNEIKTLMILDELPSIVGVDKNVYGPVYPQDLITIPEPNARILVKNKKGIFIQTYK